MIYLQVFDEICDHRSDHSCVGSGLSVGKAIAATPVNEQNVVVARHQELVFHVFHPLAE